MWSESAISNDQVKLVLNQCGQVKLVFPVCRVLLLFWLLLLISIVIIIVVIIIYCFIFQMNLPPHSGRWPPGRHERRWWLAGQCLPPSDSDDLRRELHRMWQRGGIQCLGIAFCPGKHSLWYHKIYWNIMKYPWYKDILFVMYDNIWRIHDSMWSIHWWVYNGIMIGNVGKTMS